MLRIAWRYYRNRPKERTARYRLLYYLAQGESRKGNSPGALRLFMEIEEFARHIDEPCFLGAVYLRIGDIYWSEHNFTRAYRYYREARGRFMRAEKEMHMAEASLGMAVSALRMHDLTRACRDCSTALELADDMHNEPLIRKSLGCFALLYVVADTIRIPEDLLCRIERTVLRDTTASGMCTRAHTQLLRNRPTDALHSVDKAARRSLRDAERNIPATRIRRHG